MQHEATEVATDAELLDPGIFSRRRRQAGDPRVKFREAWSNGHGNRDNIYKII